MDAGAARLWGLASARDARGCGREGRRASGAAGLQAAAHADGGVDVDRQDAPAPGVRGRVRLSRGEGLAPRRRLERVVVAIRTTTFVLRNPAQLRPFGRGVERAPS